MARANGVIGFLTRLRGDVRGNTLAIMAAAMIPLCAFAGSAIDLGRLYVVRTRLQTACDSGVLAGRKFIDTTTQKAGTLAAPVALDAPASTQAQAYFNNNFSSSWGASRWFVSGTNVFTPGAFYDDDKAIQVTGSASANVPMTLMAIFGQSTRKLTVTCQARFDTPDTDVVFVLDTTGSMACLPSDDPSADCGGSTTIKLADGSTDYYDTEKTGSKMDAVRNAVSQFFDTMDNNTAKPSFLRYGFVPYSSTVNMGKAIYDVNPGYLASTWTYQTRVPADYLISNDSGVIDTTKNQAQCIAITLANSRSPAVTDPLTYNSSGQATKQVGSWNSSTGKCKITTYTYGPQWTYQQRAWNTASYVASVSSGTATDPTKAVPTQTSWQGCIEEVNDGKKSYNAVGSYNIDALPANLNPDWIPTTTDDSTKWGPMWPSAVYARRNQAGNYNYQGTATQTGNDESLSSPDPYRTSGGAPYPPAAPNYAGQTMRMQGFAPCGGAVMRLTNINTTKNPAESGTKPVTKTDITTYMAGLHPHGGTYHDIGMLWGLRMISPQGIFAADTAKHGGHADPKRVIVFLTDGAMAPNTYSYGSYGIEYFDGRVSGSGSSISNTSLADYHNARFLATCKKATEKNIQVWVVAVGQSLTQPLKDCVGAAHPERAIFVNNSTDLAASFKQIATAISMLRISQ